jgi:ABC-type multidrug transport system fused ATPase/permease subunit
MQKIPSQKKDERLIAKISTWGMTAIAGLQALSGSIFLGASILGLVFGAFTLTTSTPLILTAFVAHHLIAVLLVSTPLAISQGLVSYILRVTSASKLFDLDKDERQAVEKNRIEYCANKPTIQMQLNKHGWDKKFCERTVDKIESEVQATDLFNDIKYRVKKLDAVGSPESKKRARLAQEKAAKKPHKTAIRKPHEKMFKPVLLEIESLKEIANLKAKLKAASSHSVKRKQATANVFSVALNRCR